YLRFDGAGQMIACVINFSSDPHPDHRIGLPGEGVWTEILNTDAESYDGTGEYGNLGQVVTVPVPSHGFEHSAEVTVGPLAAVFFRYVPPEPTTTSAEPTTTSAEPSTTLAEPTIALAEPVEASPTAPLARPERR
ncbi:MAG: alpha amylase C-terminal domain-containing protein, partial [Propionibacteriales bacterium]|nr:alpha amylase C-terminal domain-containing protein [Propionibacteriales bacterium]